MLPERPDILLLFNKSEFAEATITQINKDLNGLSFAEIAVDFSLQTSIIDQLVLLLKPILHDLSRRHPEQLSQFIYRVDLGENKFFDSIGTDPSLADLTYLVIEREAQKVWLRFKSA